MRLCLFASSRLVPVFNVCISASRPHVIYQYESIYNFCLDSFGECIYIANELFAYVKQQLLFLQVILVDGKAFLRTVVQVQETLGIVVFWDSLQLGRNATLDVQNVRKSQTLRR